MSPTKFYLITLSTSHEAFLSDLKDLPPSERPYWIGRCQHWLHKPHLSTTILDQKWDYLVVTRVADYIPSSVKDHLAKTWSIVAETPDEMISSIPSGTLERKNQQQVALPKGWSPSDHNGLDAATADPDLEASIEMETHPLASSNSISLKDFTRQFGTSHPGPVAMYNLLSYLPDQRSQYFKYVEAFNTSVGKNFGGTPIILGLGVTGESEGGDGKFEDTAVVWYPSIWHFSKMLDDENYKDVDRKYKQGVLRDNPLLCCTEVEVGYDD